MKISLRKANAIQSAITDEINNIDLKTDVTVNEFEILGEKVSQAETKFFQNMEKRNALVEALYDIRAQVSGVNASSGINGLLTILAQTERDIQLYNRLSRIQPSVDSVVLEGRLEKIRQRKEDVYGREEQVQTSIFNEATIDTFKSKLASLKKKKQKLQDELLEMNVRTEIQLEAKTVNILESINIL